jgi:hypothetical protein
LYVNNGKNITNKWRCAKDGLQEEEKVHEEHCIGKYVLFSDFLLHVLFLDFLLLAFFFKNLLRAFFFNFLIIIFLIWFSPSFSSCT